VQDDCIAAALGLSGLMVLGQIELDDHFEVTVRYLQDKVACPDCGSMMVRKHGSSFQRKKDKKDRKLGDKIVVLTLEQKRFRCLPCNSVFTGTNEVFGPSRRSSERLRKYLGDRAMHQTINRVANEGGVSESLVRRSFTEATVF